MVLHLRTSTARTEDSRVSILRKSVETVFCDSAIYNCGHIPRDHLLILDSSRLSIETSGILSRGTPIGYLKRPFSVPRSCLFVGSARSGSYFEGVNPKSLNIIYKPSTREIRHEGSLSVSC